MRTMLRGLLILAPAMLLSGCGQGGVSFADDIQPIIERSCISCHSGTGEGANVSEYLMTDLSQHVPSATLVTAGRLVLRAGMAARVCNLFISNVPGPQVPLYMNGAQQVATYGIAPLVDGMGLFIATPSYNGNITFNVTSTRETLPDIHFFIECIEKSLDELRKATTKPRAAKKRKKKSTGA